MDYNRFYKQLFHPIEGRIGPVDEASMVAIIGFDVGGPVNLCTVGYGRQEFVTYITCELAVREEQQPAAMGRYEFMMTCHDEEWARRILTKLGQASLERAFADGDTADISGMVPRKCILKGLVFEEFSRTTIDGGEFGILQVHGVTRSELQFALGSGVDNLIARLKETGIYPRTSVNRKEASE